MKKMILGALAIAFVSSTLFAGSAHAVLAANGLTLNGLPSINGMSGHNGLSSINGMSGHNGLAVLRNIHAARAAIWISNGIDPSRPLSQITARR